MAKNEKHRGSDFNSHLLENLGESDELVFLHIKNALENPDIGEPNDYQYLVKAIGDVAKARGKGDIAEKSGITRQGLHKILKGDSVPSIQNVMALLDSIGLKFSVEKVGRVISDNVPASVLDVAQYAASLMPRKSTVMKLQKIVYYSQVESLVHYNKSLFPEKIEAWAAGPVVRELFDRHKGLRHINDIKFGEPANLSTEQKTCVEWAISKYGTMDGDTLSHLTHVEEPWKHTRGKLRSDAPSNKEITVELIREYYSSLPNYSALDDSDK